MSSQKKIHLLIRALRILIRCYYLLNRLIEDCWDEQPSKRPSFKEIIAKLDDLNKHIVQKRRWKVRIYLFSSVSLAGQTCSVALKRKTIQIIQHQSKLLYTFI